MIPYTRVVWGRIVDAEQSLFIPNVKYFTQNEGLMKLKVYLATMVVKELQPEN